MGKLAYAAYCNAVGGTTFDGRPLPTWEELGQRQRDGWEAAAQAIYASRHWAYCNRVMACMDYDERDEDPVDIECEIIHETDKAVLIYDGQHNAWIPKSKMLGFRRPNKDSNIRIIRIPEWLAIDKGLA